YIFSSEITRTATGGSQGLLSVLLFGYGIAGIVGNVISGPLTDRLGSRGFGVATLVVQVVLLALLPVLDGSFVGTLVLFIVWGVTAFAAGVPLQHRLVQIDPGNASVALSWWATATYLGIAVAPLLGAGALAVSVQLVPVVGAVLAAVAIGFFLFGFVGRGSRHAPSALLDQREAAAATLDA
ncbi:MAG: MFS transporter, partial [Actinomycetota bacterium]|nr:MFS transporter [Actinomycetota bacterium]